MGSPVRQLRPRVTDSLSVTPATVTDRTAPVVLGLEARAFREFVLRLGVRHVTVGRRVVARVSDVLDALDRAAVAGPAVGAEQPLSDVDAMLARLGRRRIGGMT